MTRYVLRKGILKKEKSSFNDIAIKMRDSDRRGLIDKFHDDFPDMKMSIVYTFTDAFGQCFRWSNIRDEVPSPEKLLFPTALLKILSPLITIEDHYSNFNSNFSIWSNHINANGDADIKLDICYVVQILLEDVISEYYGAIKNGDDKAKARAREMIVRSINDCYKCNASQFCVARIEIKLFKSDNADVPFISID